MICTKCFQTRVSKDFFINKTLCYKCIFKEKTRKSKTKDKDKGCRICKEKCGKGRRVYCGRKCAAIGEAKQKRQHWTLKVKSI